MLLWRWLMMAVRMVDRFIIWAHWARPRVNSSFQQARTKLVFASWLRQRKKSVSMYIEDNALYSYSLHKFTYWKTVVQSIHTQELRRQGWSAPSAWREREVWMLTHRCNAHSDTRAWGWAWSATQRGKDRDEGKRKLLKHIWWQIHAKVGLY